MRGYIALTVLCFLNVERTLASTANKHVFYTGPADAIKIPDEDIELLFHGIDRDKNGKISMKDLFRVFQNPHSEDDVYKFLREADSDDPEQDVDLKEFKEFMSDISAVWAIAGCKNPKKSNKLKLHCYEDYFITYIHIMLTFDEVDAFFQYFDLDKSGKITTYDVKDKIILKDYNVTDEVYDKVIQNIMEEWGNEDSETDFAEFKSYVRQEDYTIDIRGYPSGDIDHYKDRLIAFTTHSVTELLIVSMFRKIDLDGNGKITQDDIGKYTTNPEHFLKTVSTDKDDSSVTFEELRLFIKKIVIKDMLESHCDSYFVREEKIDCSVKHLFTITKFAYRLPKIIIPHSDLFYMFEELDSKITASIDDEELARFESDENVRKLILIELDTSQSNSSINFDEFTYFLSFPSSVYALSSCLSLEPQTSNTTKNQTEQTRCFIDKFIDFAGHMMSYEEMTEFFRSYQNRGTDILNRDDVNIAIPDPKGKYHNDDVDNFIVELGMGDDEITIHEFGSYVRHLDLREEFKARPAIEEKQKTLLNYITNRLTEYDMELVFEGYDTSENYELDADDFGEVDDDVHKFLKALDSDDEEETVDFQEFRYFCTKPEIRAKLEESCTTVKLREEQERKLLEHPGEQLGKIDKIQCYIDLIWTMTTKSPSTGTEVTEPSAESTGTMVTEPSAENTGTVVPEPNNETT